MKGEQAFVRLSILGGKRRQWPLSLFIFIFFLTIGFAQNTERVIYHLPRDQKIVALTFDDGPHYHISAELLDLFRREEIKVTFFVVGQSVEYRPDLVYRMHKEGHDIGNHSYSHLQLDKISEQSLSSELSMTNKIIEGITKRKVTIMRAPGGRYNENVYKMSDVLGLKVVNWSLNTGDYNLFSPLFEKGKAIFYKRGEVIAAEVLERVGPGDIILMHNGNKETVKALKIIIPKLKADGYQFVKVSDYI